MNKLVLVTLGKRNLVRGPILKHGNQDVDLIEPRELNSEAKILYKKQYAISYESLMAYGVDLERKGLGNSYVIIDNTDTIF